MDTIGGSAEFLALIARMGFTAKNACLSIIPVFIVITGIFGVVKFYFGQEENGKININKYIVYNIFMLILLMNYEYIIDTTGSVTRILTENIFPRENSSDMFETVSDSKIKYYMSQRGGRMLNNYADYINVAKSDDSNWVQKSWAYLKMNFKETTDEALSEKVVTPLQWTKSMMEVSFVRLVRSMLELSRMLMLGFLIIVGPFALLFETIPLFRGIASHWYKLLFAVSLWLLTLNILDALYIGFSESLVQSVQNEIVRNVDILEREAYARAMGYDHIMNPTGKFTYAEYVDPHSGQGLHLGLLNIAMAILYMFVPYLTTIYAGGQVAQQLFGAMMSMAQMVMVNTLGSVRGVGMPSGGGDSAIKGITKDNT
jgi:TM2 domain-containing membrane protein YozV